jgi:hypothetical protein
MKWTDVRRRIREIWPEIEGFVPERKKRSACRIVYEDRLVFEAICKMVWDDHPMRISLGPPYPTFHPLYRRIAVLVQSRALDKMWAGYLKQQNGGERGIRTLGTGYYQYDGLANRCFRPLSHLSVQGGGKVGHGPGGSQFRKAGRGKTEACRL